MGLGRIPDQYTVRARLLPALLVALPAGVAALAWFPDGILGWGAVWGLVTWSGGTLLLAQLGRDAGKRKEPRLFELWGGKPTTRMLRHAGGANPVTLGRRHAKLKSLMRDVRFPTPEEEAADPHAADEVYEACTTVLRDKTRDRKRFDLIFEENCNYGFRRNLWGMRPLGLVIALLALAVIAGVPVLDSAARSGGRLGLVAVTGAVDLLVLLGWLFVFTPGWVRVAGEAYAERLLEASERL